MRPFLAFHGAGFRSLQAVIVSDALSARLSLASKIPFLTGDWSTRASDKRSDLRRAPTRLQAEVPELLAPISVRIPQSFDVDATGKASFDGSLDELWSKE